jgi:hypothetical protein
MRGSGRSRCGFSPGSTACRMYISRGFVGFCGYHFRVSATGQRKTPERRRRNVRHCPRCLTVVTSDTQTESSGTGAPTLATSTQRRLDFSLRTPERPMQMRRFGRLPVKSELRSQGMGATQREGVRGGSPPAFHPKFHPKTSVDF